MRLQPPIIHCGGFIDTADFRLRAATRRLAHLQVNEPDSAPSSKIPDVYGIYDLDPGDTSDEPEPDEIEATRLREIAQASRDYDTCDALAKDVMLELGLNNERRQYVVAVRGMDPSTPKNSIRLGFALYDNYNLKSRLDEKDIQKVRDAFGFKGKPMWFMDAIETYWAYDA